MNASASVAAGRPIPTVRTLPLIGDLYRLAFEDGIAYFSGLQRRYGPIARFRLGPIRAVLVTDPALVGHVLGRDVRTWSKGRHFDSTRLFLGKGIFVAEGQTWSRQRRMLNPRFTESEIHRQYTDIMVQTTRQTIDAWLDQPGAPLDMEREMNHLAMNIIIQAMFGPHMAQQQRYGDHVRACLDFVMERGRNPFALPMSVPLPAHQKFKAHKKALEEFIFRAMKESEARPDDRSLIRELMAARDEEGKSRLTPEEVKDQVLTVFLAGHETTALALCWTFYLLARHPDVEAKVRAEMAAVVGDGDVRAEHLPQLTYIRQVIMEVLRLYPPVGFYPRQSDRDQMVGPYSIREGEQIMLSPYITQRLPEYWEQPDEFRPERFSEEALREQHPFAWFPFGKGRRICLGKEFAETEMALVLVSTLQKVRLDLLTPEIKPKFVATLRPVGLQMQARSLQKENPA